MDPGNDKNAQPPLIITLDSDDNDADDEVNDNDNNISTTSKKSSSTAKSSSVIFKQKPGSKAKNVTQSAYRTPKNKTPKSPRIQDGIIGMKVRSPNG